jgi:hypothetical protein
MSDKHLEVEPSLPAANVAHLARLLEEASLISLDGEILAARDADNGSLAAWMLAAKRMREIARRMEDLAGGELLTRCRQIAGPIDTEFGTARESISRGSVSGIQSERIRAVLEEAAADGTIPWEAVDNVAPLKAHVTPARLAEYADTIGGQLGETLDGMLPEKRRTIKLDERSV